MPARLSLYKYSDGTSSDCDNHITNLLSLSLLFWVADDTIIMKTLNGLVEQVCHVAANTPAALITDPVRMRLYWVSKLSDNCVVSVNTPYCVSVAEVDYTRSGCDR